MSNICFELKQYKYKRCTGGMPSTKKPIINKTFKQFGGLFILMKTYLDY